ncbi:MAG: hypothetical protein GC168_18375 [Candidatus Hydrogenedens sp.]|nr:hypothetical protein [Candidatus Hydrogenedens sp.]
MLRSLLIRQIFFWVDIALAVAFVCTAGVVVYGLLTPLPVQAEISPGPIDIASFQLARVESRDAYNDLGLFGEIGRFDPETAPPPPPPPPVDTTVEETSLNLRLIGTTVVPGMSSAIIEMSDRNQTASTYVLDEDVMDGVKLVEIGKREVYILNSRGGEPKREKLSMDDQEDLPNAPQMAQAPQPEPEHATGGIQRITLNRNDLAQEIMSSYSDIVTKVRPELARDNNGDVLGVTAANISTVPLARKLGLNDGDILQTVNNEKIDSEGKIYEMIQKYQNASSIRLGIVSNGQPKVITYRIN